MGWAVALQERPFYSTTSLVDDGRAGTAWGRWGVWTVVSGDADEEGGTTSGTWIGQSHLERTRSITYDEVEEKESK